MDIVGNGFIARSLRPLADRHPDAVALAAGVSWAGGTSKDDFAREEALLHEVAHEAKTGGRLLLFFSTASAGMYGAAGTSPARESEPVVPCSPYGAHKLALEEHVRASGADYLVLRLGHLVGPGQPPHQLVPTLVRQIRAGTVRVQRGATRDLIGVDDTVTVIDRLLALGLRGETVNVASGVAVPVERIVGHLERRLGPVAHEEFGDAGAQHVVSIAKLRALVPEVAGMGFDPGYYRRVLDAAIGTCAPATAGA